MKPRRTPNSKRCLLIHASEEQLEQIRQLSKKASYGGNPEHKKNPGDFKLNPPSIPRQGKSLCDELGIFTREQALSLLREGFERGLVSEQMRGDWPQNVWSVFAGRVLEAMLENPQQGAYHGYPMPLNDPFADAVLKRWNSGNA
jgi:hypothetical protein